MKVDYERYSEYDVTCDFTFCQTTRVMQLTREYVCKLSLTAKVRFSGTK